MNDKDLTTIPSCCDQICTQGSLCAIHVWRWHPSHMVGSHVWSYRCMCYEHDVWWWWNKPHHIKTKKLNIRPNDWSRSWILAPRSDYKPPHTMLNNFIFIQSLRIWLDLCFSKWLKLYCIFLNVYSVFVACLRGCCAIICSQEISGLGAYVQSLVGLSNSH